MSVLKWANMEGMSRGKNCCWKNANFQDEERFIDHSSLTTQIKNQLQELFSGGQCPTHLCRCG